MNLCKYPNSPKNSARRYHLPVLSDFHLAKKTLRIFLKMLLSKNQHSYP
jgi:hypothetical protein